ncbi:hypothetical protein FD754_000281 [Muntiacus muntjak]|uniref:HMG box domain-containing protein n=1 Tax=Muntiacus muntjak TaxID=9888 RepID=A0A5N3W619_MUNMU|nr:hypothetical protein FD754_000281 [Muntiacus muntjak]
MGKGDPNKRRGKMSPYAFSVQTCREEHKKQHPDSSVNFAEFSRKVPRNGRPCRPRKKGKEKDPNTLKRPPSAFFLFCSEYHPKIKSKHPGLSIGDTAKKMGEMWSEQSAKDKQPYEQKDIAAYRAKGKSSKKKNEPEDEEEEDEDEEEEKEDEE